MKNSHFIGHYSSELWWYLRVVEVSSVYTVEALDVGVALGFDCRPIEGPVDGHIEAILSHVMEILV